MKNKIVFIALFACVAFLSACTAEYKLEVVNHSAQPLTITYKLKEGGRFDEPEIMSIEEWKKVESEPKPLAADAYSTDAENRERILTLPPNTAVVLERGIWDTDRKGGMTQTVDIKLSGASGTATYSGENFYKNLNKDGGQTYTIEYR